ncbi:hypothetical protein ISCGN_016948 [Ixodes scapularis]
MVWDFLFDTCELNVITFHKMQGAYKSGSVRFPRCPYMFYRNCSQPLVPIPLIFRKLCRTMPLFFGRRTCEPALHATSWVYSFRSRSWKFTTGTHYSSPTPQCTKQLILEYRTTSGTNITAKESHGEQFPYAACRVVCYGEEKKKTHGRV